MRNIERETNLEEIVWNPWKRVLLKLRLYRNQEVGD